MNFAMQVNAKQTNVSMSFVVLVEFATDYLVNVSMTFVGISLVQAVKPAIAVSASVIAVKAQPVKMVNVAPMAIVSPIIATITDVQLHKYAKKGFVFKIAVMALLVRVANFARMENAPNLVPM